MAVLGSALGHMLTPKAATAGGNTFSQAVRSNPFLCSAIAPAKSKSAVRRALLLIDHGKPAKAFADGEGLRNCHALAVADGRSLFNQIEGRAFEKKGGF
jgi:hypothetical protein